MAKEGNLGAVPCAAPSRGHPRVRHVPMARQSTPTARGEMHLPEKHIDSPGFTATVSHKREEYVPLHDRTDTSEYQQYSSS